MGNAGDAIAGIQAQRLKPHDLAQQLERTAQTLSPADLPVFYDLAARELIRLGDYKRAATMFANARTAESSPGAPPVADDVWLDKHREFAAYGALGTKSVADFVKALKTRADPQTAVETLARVADPRASVPELVARVAEEHGLGSDAATLYLQLLAMPNPSDKRVRAWNRWNTAVHKAAVTELLVKGLVAEEKRPKAGRGIVLPGTWRKARNQPGSRPIEQWKIGLLDELGLDDHHEWPAMPLPELFEAAWKRAGSTPPA